jgi:ribosomal protein S18 acetylase RimI-like enzyme
MQGLPPIRVWESHDAELEGSRLYDVVDRAFRSPPHTGVEPRDVFVANWERQVRRDDFRLLTIEEPGTRVIGFLYGYRGRTGTWWFDTVSAAVSEEVRNRWFANAFEIVSMAIDPAFQGRGWGTSLLRECLAIAPTRTAVLSTQRDANPAVRLYLREGFRVVHPGLTFAPDGPPFVVMAREISGSLRPK